VSFFTSVAMASEGYKYQQAASTNNKAGIRETNSSQLLPATVVSWSRGAKLHVGKGSAVVCSLTLRLCTVVQSPVPPTLFVAVSRCNLSLGAVVCWPGQKFHTKCPCKFYIDVLLRACVVEF